MKDFKSSEQIIQRILTFTGHSGSVPLIKKFNVQYISNILDRTKIQSIDKVYKSKEDGFNLLQFVRFFLNVIDHEEVQTLYLAVALVDFFKEISQLNGFKEKIMFVDITNYICNRILQKRNDQNEIESKYISNFKSIKPSFKIKDYLVNPPKIYANKDEAVYKLAPNKVKIDKTKHQSVVTNCYFSTSLNKVFTLDILSDSISVYNSSCTLIKKIKPNFSKLKKDIVVLSFAYSQRQQRIGAVLKDFSMNFWDNSDNFQFQKSISTASHCQQYQTNIWFLQYFNKWVTASDKSGILYIWDIELQVPERKLKLVYDTKVNDICIIDCLNLVAIVQERKVDELLRLTRRDADYEVPSIIFYDFFKGQAVAKIQLNSDNRVPHTIQYSQNYQVLLLAGYEKKISIYEINKVFLDTNLKGELTGHQSLVTSFTLLKKSPMVVSADDKGKVKVWDIRNYKCIQTLDFRDKTNITKLLDMMPLGKIGVFGSRINFVQFDQKMQILKRNQNKQKLHPLWVDCDYNSHELIVMTKKDLRVYDLVKGVVKCIYCEFHIEDQEITSFKYLEAVRKFIIGNEKGEIKLFCIRTGKLQCKLEGHSSSVTFIEYDQQNKLFISMGQDSSIQIQKQISIQNEQDLEGIQLNPKSEPRSQKSTLVLRQMKNNFYGRQISIGTVSVYHGLIAVGSSDKTIYIWDYEFAKLLLQINLPDHYDQNTETTSLAFINGYSIIVIGTSNGQLHFLRLNKFQFTYSIELLETYKSKQCQAITHILVDLLVKGFSQCKEELVSSNIHIGYSQGKIQKISIQALLLKNKQQPSVGSKQNFNPERQLRENFLSEIQKKKFVTFTIPKVQQSPQFKTFCYEDLHKSCLTAISMIEFDDRYLMTTGVDGRIKIWNQKTLTCDSNINLPLPYKWQIKIKEQQKMRDKIMFALKIIQKIFLKFGTDISIGESKLLKVRKLIDQINEDVQIHLTEPKLQETVTLKLQPILFQDEFTRKDLHYDLVKQFNFTQIAGPTLRELQVQKKLDFIQTQWQNNKDKLEVDKAKLLQTIRTKAHKNEEKDQILQFLDERPFFQERKTDVLPNNNYIKNLSHKLDQMTNLCQYHDVQEDKPHKVQSTYKILKENKIFLNNFYQKSKEPKRLVQSRKDLRQKYQQKNTFQKYFQKKEVDEQSTFFHSGRTMMNKKYSCQNKNKNFRDILQKMNEKVKVSKQGRSNESLNPKIENINYFKIATSHGKRKK